MDRTTSYHLVLQRIGRKEQLPLKPRLEDNNGSVCSRLKQTRVGINKLNLHLGCVGFMLEQDVPKLSFAAVLFQTGILQYSSESGARYFQEAGRFAFIPFTHIQNLFDNI